MVSMTVMRQQDLFATEDGYFHGQEMLRHELLHKAMKGPLSDVSDLDLADVLVRLTRTEFSAFGSGMKHGINNGDMRLLLRACIVVCQRAGVSFPNLPFRDLDSFRAYWIAEGMAGSYAARTTYIDREFQPIEDQILRMSVTNWEDVLITPVSPHDGTGWNLLDSEIRELRQRFAMARTDQDHCAVGAACVRILEHLGEVAFDPAVHWKEGTDVPPRGNTKDRFDAVIVHAILGPDNDKLRKLARAVVEVAQDVKHRKTPCRRDAGIAADSVIALANLLRRLSGCNGGAK
jgi:hypothetical protein